MPTPKRPAYFVHDPARGTWQLVGGSGSPLTAPRAVEGPEADSWRAQVLALAKSPGVRVRSAGAWIGRVIDSGAFVPFHLHPEDA